MKKLSLLAILFTFTFFSCSKKHVNMSVLKPAPLTVEQHIKTIVIVNRTEPENKVLNTIEGILTGEGIGEDKQGADQALASLNGVMATSPRFQPKRALERYKGSGAGGVLPDPLAWKIVQALCEKYQADAVIALETYDSDFIITHTEKDVEEKDANGNVVMRHKFYAEGLASVKMGFRLYDPNKMTIIDQHMFSDSRTWTGTGTNKTDALAHLINKNTAIQQVSQRAGANYASRITPLVSNISRVLYKKGKGGSSLSSGTRMADVQDWEGAIEKWEQSLQTGDTKSKGRAAYNIAVGYEVLGYYQEAKDWAQKAYIDYGNKEAKNYVSALDQRIRDDMKLQEQLGIDL